MIFDITYMEWLTLLFFIIVAILLIINILTIGKLKEDKTKLADNEKLLTQLLGHIQNYFSKIDASIANVATEEQALIKMFDAHQKDEDMVLKALELNQTLFLDRMDKIVNIQQSLSDKLSLMKSGGHEGLISSEMIKGAMYFMTMQKKDMLFVKEQIASLSELTEPLNRLVDIENIIKPDFSTLTSSIEESFLLHIKGLEQSIQTIKEEALNQGDALKSSTQEVNEAIANIKTLTQHTDIAKRNIQNVIEQSIDLNPIYKSVHELVEQIKTIFEDYHLAKNEISTLLQSLQEHEHKDLVELKNEVTHFLHDITGEIRRSVEMLKDEYHLGQNQVTDTVKTLSDRSKGSSVYQKIQEEQK